MVELALGHEVGEMQLVEVAAQLRHRVAGFGDRRDEACSDGARAGSRDAGEGVPGLVQHEHGARQPDSLHATAFEGEVGAELPAVLGVLRIDVTVGLAQVVSRRRKFLL